MEIYDWWSQGLARSLQRKAWMGANNGHTNPLFLSSRSLSISLHGTQAKAFGAVATLTIKILPLCTGSPEHPASLQPTRQRKSINNTKS